MTHKAAGTGRGTVDGTTEEALRPLEGVEEATEDMIETGGAALGGVSSRTGYNYQSLEPFSDITPSSVFDSPRVCPPPTRYDPELVESVFRPLYGYTQIGGAFRGISSTEEAIEPCALERTCFGAQQKESSRARQGPKHLRPPT